ncbi:MAG: hypothetical protein RJQ04_18115 [Longimicrobiales bacterium]
MSRTPPDVPQRIIHQSARAVRRLNRWSLRLLGVVGRVRPDERREAVAAFLTLFGFMVGHGLLETARDALFLARLPARQLPWVYLAIAVLALAIGQREPRVVRRLSGGTELGRWLVAAGAVTLAFYSVAGRPWPWVFYGLYTWSGVLATLVVVRFWTVLGSRFTLTQAKRLFPLVATGSVAGALVGAGAARGLTSLLPAQHLVLAAGLVFLATARAPAVLGDAAPRAPAAEPDDLPRLARLVWGAPYLRRVALLVLLATVTFTLIDFVFKSAADRYVPPDQLGAFFSSVYLALNLASLVVQVFVVGWLLRSAGVIAAAAVVPALLMASTLGFAVGGGLGLALVLKGTDGSFRHSLYRTVTELLFLPLSERLRTRVKGVIDVLGQRGGQALASIVILMVLSSTGEIRVFAALACLAAVGWLFLAVGLKDHYLDVFREVLHEDLRGRSVATEFPALDVASLETLLATLNSPDERRVVAALGVLRDQGKVGVVPALLLYHPAPSVVLATLEVLQDGDRDDAVPLARRLLRHADADVRAAAVRMITAAMPDRAVLEEAASDPDAAVVATARMGLLACGWLDGGAADALADGVAGAPGRVREAMARALVAGPTATVEPLLLRLLASDEPDVLRAAIDAARTVRTPDLVPPLLALLARRAVRDDARAALASFGSVGLARMAETLSDASVPLTVRRHLPGAMALVGSRQVPDLLLRHLQTETDGLVRFKVLRALGRWRNEQPDLPLDPRLLGDALEQALSTGYRLMGWRADLVQAGRASHGYRTELHRVLLDLLRDKQDHALERVFRLLNLQAGTEDFQRLYRGLHSPRGASRAGSRELLRHLVPAGVRHHLLTLIDDLHGEPEARPPLSGRVSDAYTDTLSALVASGMESVSSLAAAHGAELGLEGLLPALQACVPVSDEHRGALDKARALLAPEAA